MTMAQISIIIPIYNAEKCLRRCLDSILKQTFTHIELLLIDDGSKDNSATICNEYANKDNRVKYIYQVNHGVSSARNKGIEHASGDWITFIDADDFIEQNFCNIVDSEESTKADLILNNIVNLQNGVKIGETLFEQHLTTSRAEIVEKYDELIHTNTFRAPWGKFFRRDIIINNRIRYDESLHYAEDTVFNLTYLKYVTSLLFNGDITGRYFYDADLTLGTTKRYKCDVKSLISVRDQTINLLRELNIHNEPLERHFLFYFTMIENCSLGKKEDIMRKKFYFSPLQLELEQKYLHQLRPWDQIMYKLFKHIPHSLIAPLATLYLKYR